jgi:hypothetical protein
MNDKESLQSSPQLARYEQRALALSPQELSPKQIHALYRKSRESGITLETLVQVYSRGYLLAESDKVQAGFSRVDSFIHGGEAFRLDNDLAEGILKKIAKGTLKVASEMGKDVIKTAFPHPSKHISRYKKAALKAMKEELTEPQSPNQADSSSRFVGTDSLVTILKKDTPGQNRADLIKRVVRDTVKGKE